MTNISKCRHCLDPISPSFTDETSIKWRTINKEYDVSHEVIKLNRKNLTVTKQHVALKQRKFKIKKKTDEIYLPKD